jgi:transcriptional regulator with XRE-family HTH domain
MSAAAKVVTLRRPSRGPIELDDGPQTIALCQSEIRRSQQKYYEIATRSGVSVQTVSNIASGDTKFPRMTTVVRILMSLGWSLYATEGR